MTLDELLDSALFRQLAPHIRIEVYGRDGGPVRVRRRIELRTGQLDAELLRQAIHTQCDCVHCGRPIWPFRPRVKGLGDRVELVRHVYLAVSCPLDINVGCSRGKPSRDAYLAIRQRVELLQATPTEPLPEGWRWEASSYGWVATNGDGSVYIVHGDELRISRWGHFSEGLTTTVGAPGTVVSAVLRHHGGSQ